MKVWPRHEGDESYIFICFDLKPMTESFKLLYKPRKQEDKKLEIDLSHNQAPCKRANFEMFYD